MAETKITLLTIKQAAELVNGLTEYRVRQMCVHGQLPHIKAGKCICRSQNRSCTDLKPHFNGYKTAPLPLVNRTKE